MLHLRASSLADTHAIAAAVASCARSGDTILLGGEMGAGKTAFAQGFGRALGVEEPITSPTFTLVHSYDLPASQRGARTLHHADLYRLDRTSEVLELALAELAEFDGIVLIEWGDVVEAVFGEHLTVLLAPTADGDHGDRGDHGDGGDDPVERDTHNGHGADHDDIGEAGGPDEIGGGTVFDASRAIGITGVGSSWADRWDRLVSHLEPFR